MTKSISKTSKMIAATAFVLGALTIGNVALASAATTATTPNTDSTITSPTTSPTPSSTVKHKTKKPAARKQTFADRIAKAVASGKLTQAQADLILAKEQEMITFRDSLATKTAKERKALMKTNNAELKKWATDNKIPRGYLLSLEATASYHKPATTTHKTTTTTGTTTNQ